MHQLLLMLHGICLNKSGKGEAQHFSLLFVGPEPASNICTAVPVGKEKKAERGKKKDQPVVYQAHGVGRP